MSKNGFVNFQIPTFILDDEPLCSQTDPELFFQQENNYGRYSYFNEKEAKAICKACPLIEKCLTYALANPDLQGIWGGTTEADRRRFRRTGRSIRR